MSLINQVLNELESRGANVPLGEDTIRAVPPRRESPVKRYAIVGVALLLLLSAALGWYMVREARPALKPAIVAVPPPKAVAIEPASAAVASASAPAVAGDESGAAPVSNLIHGKPLLVVKSDEQAAAPAVPKAPPHRRKQKAEQPVEGSEHLPPENPEIQQFKTVSPMQRAESEFQKANLAVKEGRINDALAGYEGALLIDSSHKAARRAWVGLLIGLKRNDDAERVLLKGIRRDPHDASFSMLLARLQVERGDIPLALETLQKTLPYAEGQAEYQAFLAALLQREDRHEDAVAHYQVALKLAPNNGIWLMGMGISLQELKRNEDARSAYQRALASNSLNPQLQAYVQQKLKDIGAAAAVQ
jgi:MSHA biogenesis protein MshN